MDGHTQRDDGAFFFFQAEDGIRDDLVSGVQTCALPISQTLPSTKDQDKIVDGKVCAAGGEAAYRYVEEAVKLALGGKIAVIVTAPLNKAAMHSAGPHFDGHTELLAHLTGAKSSFMLLASDKLNAIHVTTHQSLKNAAERPTIERVVATIRAGHEHFRELGIDKPRISLSLASSMNEDL